MIKIQLCLTCVILYFNTSVYAHNGDESTEDHFSDFGFTCVKTDGRTERFCQGLCWNERASVSEKQE
jgi:hypothetical protein